jgi:hypothetical protein
VGPVLFLSNRQTPMNELGPITQVPPPPLLELSALAAKVPLAEKSMILSNQKSRKLLAAMFCACWPLPSVVISKLS